MFISSTMLAKVPGSLGRIYNVEDYVSAVLQANPNTAYPDRVAFQQCLTDMATFIFDSNSTQVVTLLIPNRPDSFYMIDAPLWPNTNSNMFVRQSQFLTNLMQINILGVNVSQAELLAAFPGLTNMGTPINGLLSNSVAGLDDYIQSHFCYTNIRCNENPASVHFLTSNPEPAMPEIRSVHPTKHYFFFFRNDAGPNVLANTTVNCMGFHLRGMDQDTNKHIFQNDTLFRQHHKDFRAGIGIFLNRFDSVFVDNVIIENIYGSGIVVVNTDHERMNDTVEIRDNIIRNVWALAYKAYEIVSDTNYRYDDVGDGISFLGIRKGMVQHNWVVNNTLETGQAGRVGIAAPAEHNIDIAICRNKVSGYDRGIHVENNYGGFWIEQNRLTGSETGLVFDSRQNACPANHPSTIRLNYISNEGVQVGNNQLIKLYPPHLFFTSGAFTSNVHSKSVLQKNYLYMDTMGIHHNYKELTDTLPGSQNVRYYSFQNSDHRWHVSSGLRRMRLECNVFYTPVAGAVSKPGGVQLFRDMIHAQPACVNLPEDIQLYSTYSPAYYPYTMVGNLVQNCHSVSINPAQNPVDDLSENHLLGVTGSHPADTAYEFGYSQPNCAEGWNNTLCNGKPIVAEHDYLWDHDTLNGLVTNYANKTILVCGTLTINANITFDSCTFLMASGASIVITNGHTLTLDGCTLMAACDELWEGIVADDPSEQLTIINSVLRDMNEGVQAKNGARLLAENNVLKDNMTAMQVLNTPPGFVSGVAGNLGVVKDNTITSTGAGPLYTQMSVTQGQYGLKLIGCAEVQIGGPLYADGNTFSHLATGVLVEPSTLQYPNAAYHLLSNRFQDIRKNPGQTPDPGIIFLNTYSNPAGTGVHIRPRHVSGEPTVIYTPTVYIAGVGLTPEFERCDKAVMGQGASAHFINNQVLHCEAGLMMNDAHYQNFLVSGNTMENVMAGVQLVGDLHTAKIQQNNISLRDLNDAAQTPSPMGIDVRYWTNLHNGITDIASNTITLPGAKGVGVHLYKTGAFALVGGNTVNFTTTNSGADDPNLAATRELHGIFSSLGDGNQLNCNTINGHTNDTVFAHRISSGITLDWSRNHEVHCNQVNNTRFGALIRANCKTDSLLFRANIFNHHFYGLSTIPGIFEEGDLGHIGDGGQDNNNLFNGTYASPQNNATYRLWSPNNPNIVLRYIYTAQQFNNGSNFLNQNLNAAFYIQTPVGSVMTCQGSYACGGQWELVTPVEIDGGMAIDIAADSVDYAIFPEVSEWVGQYQLYGDLERDSLLRASNAILNSFYQTQQNQAMGNLRSVEQKLRLLSDSTSRADSSLYLSRLQDAKQVNQGVSGIENYILNEKWANEMYMRVLEDGRDSLSQEEVEEIHSLAHSCPAVNGLGVYLARFLNAYYEPLADYNDYVLCNAANKNGAPVFDYITRFLSDPSLNSMPPIHAQDEQQQIMAYPIPAQDRVQFSSALPLKQAGMLRLFDLSGKEVRQQVWQERMEDNSMDVQQLANGLYYYTIVLGQQHYYGKLSVQH